MLQNRFWQAFFAIAPIVLLFVFFIGYFVFVFSLITEIQEIEAHGSVSPSFIFGRFLWLFAGVLLMVLISLGSLIFFIVHAVQNPNLKENNLLLVWILLFVFIGGLGQLLYWIIEIIGKRKTNT
ncbi:hypothetical protein [uncultured Croceitalea sp.]|uniref:hypothetical protein n=1 Tax=uncultured Croceitalea sp. TaxID=1798908 RepID=UPI0033056920